MEKKNSIREVTTMVSAGRVLLSLIASLFYARITGRRCSVHIGYFEWMIVGDNIPK
jgi:hypothetical protein